MISKVYDKIKHFFKENKKKIIVYVVFLITVTVRLPFYINAPGGLIDISEKIKILNSTNSVGSLNFAYVSEIKATLPTVLISLINKDWDLLKKEEVVLENETPELLYYRDHLLMEESNDNAILVAYQKAKKEVSVTNRKFIITYVDKDAVTDLQVKDQILEIDDKVIKYRKDIEEYINSLNTGDNVKIKVLSNGNIVYRKAEIKSNKDKNIIGIMITERKELETIPEISLTFDKSESGPSGGLMLSLAIYDKLVEEDLTRGKTIVGTGTIDEYGNVGSIGGVIFKLKGAVKKGAEIFIVPNGINYEEAMKIKEERELDIEIVGVSSFDQALEYLLNLKR